MDWGGDISICVWYLLYMWDIWISIFPLRLLKVHWALRRFNIFSVIAWLLNCKIYSVFFLFYCSGNIGSIWNETIPPREMYFLCVPESRQTTTVLTQTTSEMRCWKLELHPKNCILLDDDTRHKREWMHENVIRHLIVKIFTACVLSHLDVYMFILWIHQIRFEFKISTVS